MALLDRNELRQSPLRQSPLRQSPSGIQEEFKLMMHLVFGDEAYAAQDSRQRCCSTF